MCYDCMFTIKVIGEVPQENLEAIKGKTNAMAYCGLRVLVYSMRSVEIETYEKWVELLENAKCLVGHERLTRVEELAREIEVDMQVIGVAGLQDRLQVGVTSCLRSLISAGIQVSCFSSGSG